MLYLVAFIAALIVAFCVWQIVKERNRRIERSKPIGSRRNR